MSVTMFGIPNCDRVKQARIWLDRRGVAYSFHDYKKSGIDRATLAGWAAQIGWQALLNRAGTTFRKLPEAERRDLDAERAIALMLRLPSLIKRPVVMHPGGLLAGFKPEEWAGLQFAGR